MENGFLSRKNNPTSHISFPSFIIIKQAIFQIFEEELLKGKYPMQKNELKMNL
jgi:hypothetical protein